MGSGIVLILCKEMLRLKLQPENSNKNYQLNCIEVNEEALNGLKNYLKIQLEKAGKKIIPSLKDHYKEHINSLEETDILTQYVKDGLSILNFVTNLEAIKNSTIIFEAIFENKDIKIKALKEAKNLCRPDTLFFTNTSSIPIHVLEEGALLEGRVIGYHFYNPPAVQKLLELIPTAHTPDELKNNLSLELAKRLGKKVIPSNDIAGFIGNGYFMRDTLFAINELAPLSENYSFQGAVYLIDKISKDFLLRPMGAFQLIDYVGLDICQCILNVMNEYIPSEELSSPIINKMIDVGVKGGQYPDGSQKPGFFKYEKNKPIGIYNLNDHEYFSYGNDNFFFNLNKAIGILPEAHEPWKDLLTDPDKDNKLKIYFSNLKNMDTLGAKLAKNYLVQSRKIAEDLVSSGVANSSKDVNATLMNGFYHLYGPINDFTTS